jgi:hypothetical protein
MIDFECPQCGNVLRVDDTAAGKTGQCKKCGNKLRVPQQIAKSVEPRPQVPPFPPRQRVTDYSRKFKWGGIAITVAAILPLVYAEIIEIDPSVPAIIAVVLALVGGSIWTYGRLQSPSPQPLVPDTTTKGKNVNLVVLGLNLTAVGCGLTVVLPFAFLAILVCFGAFNAALQRNQKATSQANDDSISGKKWYEGGTLHKKSALDWQTANYEDKLATCSDFIAKMWDRKSFTDVMQNSIMGVQDFKPYATQLVACIDAATKRLPDVNENRTVYANQAVSDMSVLCMVTMGWMKRI